MKNKKKIISEIRIKLGQRHKNGSPAVQKFMKAFMEASDPHPFDHNSRVFGGTTIHLSPDNYEVHIHDVQSLNPKSGAGTKAMKALLKLADKHHVNLNAVAKAYAKHGDYIKDTEKLVSWYRKLGFDIEDADENDTFYYDGVEIKYYSK
jgi:hypothetical protein